MCICKNAIQETHRINQFYSNGLKATLFGSKKYVKKIYVLKTPLQIGGLKKKIGKKIHRIK